MHKMSFKTKAILTACGSIFAIAGSFALGFASWMQTGPYGDIRGGNLTADAVINLNDSSYDSYFETKKVTMTRCAGGGFVAENATYFQYDYDYHAEELAVNDNSSYTDSERSEIIASYEAEASSYNAAHAGEFSNECDIVWTIAINDTQALIDAGLIKNNALNLQMGLGYNDIGGTSYLKIIQAIQSAAYTISYDNGVTYSSETVLTCSFNSDRSELTTSGVKFESISAHPTIYISYFYHIDVTSMISTDFRTDIYDVLFADRNVLIPLSLELNILEAN